MLGSFLNMSTNQKIDVYETSDVIGKGYGGIIKKGILKDENGQIFKEAALKCMTLRNGAPQKNHEDEIMEKLNHENVLKLYTTIKRVSLTGQIYLTLVMELCNNGNLAEYLKNNKLTETQIQMVFQQMVKGLEHLDSKKILHRDIKPTNILVQGYTIKIADYNVSKETDKTLHTGGIGTPEFQAPEVLDDKDGYSHYGPPSDIFSLGITLFYIYFQKTPWNLTNDMRVKDVLEHYKERINEIEKSFKTENVEIGEDAKDIILKMICFDQHERIKLQDILIHPYVNFEIINKIANHFFSMMKYVDLLQKCVKYIYDFHIFCSDLDLWNEVLLIICDEIHNEISFLYWILQDKKKKDWFYYSDWEIFYKSKKSKDLQEKLNQMLINSKNNLLILDEKTPNTIKYKLKLSKSEMKSKIQKILILYREKFAEKITKNAFLGIYWLVIVLKGKTDNILMSITSNNKNTIISAIEEYYSSIINNN